MEQSDLFAPDLLVSKDNLRGLRERALVCQKCELHKTRTQVVFGSGLSENPPFALVGEGPGENEDLKGLPFIGRAGQLLDQMLKAMGYDRSQIYICNVVNCRPPANRKPEPAEIAACKEHLVGQLRAVQPKVIIALGATAAHTLLKSIKPIGELRGRWYAWENIPVRCTYHPAYLLRDSSKKKDVWADLQLIQSRLTAMASYGTTPAASIETPAEPEPPKDSE